MESLHLIFSGYCALVFLLITSVLTTTLRETSSANVADSEEWDILMRDAKPRMPDAYLCTAYPVEYEEAYIYKFEALAEASTAHHMLLYGCDGEPAAHQAHWGCPPMCKNSRTQTIMFAWAKNAPPTALPKDVGLKIGQNSRIKTIVLQVHYAKAFSSNSVPDKSGLKLFITRQRQLYSAGILLMVSGFFQIPPRQSAYPVDISCQYPKKNSIFPFAYRTHAHGRGKVITGYKYNGTFYEIGKGNPQWPQAFYPVKNKIEVKHNDFLAGRCTYDSSKDSSPTNVGATGDDEMCNFYIMYYTDSSAEDKPFECFNNQYPDITAKFPEDVSMPLPYNAELEAEAKGHHHHGHAAMGSHDQAQQETQAPVESHADTIHSNGLSEKDEMKSTRKSSSNMGNSHEIDSPHSSHEEKIIDYYHKRPKQPAQNGAAGADTRRANQILYGNNDFGSNPQAIYDFDNINPRDLSHKSRISQEYYDDYAANDRREQDQYRDPDSDVELSRNRNKEFDAMDKQLQQQYSQGTHPNSRPSKPQYHQKPRGSSPHQGQGLRTPSAHQGTSHAGQTAQWREHSKGGNRKETPHSSIHIEKKLVYQPSWPSETLDIGQVGGVSADHNGNVYIFHRASRIWNAGSFDKDDNFQYQDAPIDEDVVLILDKNGKLVRKFGKGQYFMPHGIKVDGEGNIWLTDVALHQVFKIRKNETAPILTLGQRFQHSEDLNYFCKPADVAVLSTGEFFVADGYCNGRVVKFSKDGKVLKAFGRKSTQWGISPGPNFFYIVHSVAVSEKDNLICAADRENGRIQCFDLDGKFQRLIKHKEFGSRLFAIDYSPLHGGLLYAVNGPDGISTVQGFTLEMKTGGLIDQWNLPQGLKNPHDVCVDPTGDSVYVGELNPRNVWKMTRMSKEDAAAVYTNLKNEHSHPDGDEHDEDHDNSVEGSESKQDSDKVTKQKTVTAHVNMTAKISNTTTNPTNSSELSKRTLAPETGLSISMIMGMVLVVPVVLLLIIIMLVRSHRSGNLKFFSTGGGKSKRIFNMQHILGNSHKGFDPLSTEESDHDLDPDDSDQEEYAAPKKLKS